MALDQHGRDGRPMQYDCPPTAAPRISSREDSAGGLERPAPSSRDPPPSHRETGAKGKTPVNNAWYRESILVKSQNERQEISSDQSVVTAMSSGKETIAKPAIGQCAADQHDTLSIEAIHAQVYPFPGCSYVLTSTSDQRALLQSDFNWAAEGTDLEEESAEGEWRGEGPPLALYVDAEARPGPQWAAARRRRRKSLCTCFLQ